MLLIAILLSLASFVAAPTITARIMGLQGGLGKGALVGLVTLGLLQLTGLVASFLGPLGDLLSMLLFLAAWYQTIKVVHGTDPARTMVFMFWHFFFVLLAASFIAVIIGPNGVSWWWQG